MLALGCVALMGIASCSSGGGGTPDNPTLTGARWSDPLTWPGSQVPQANDNVEIGVGQTIVLDTATANLDTLRIAGTLVADPAMDVAITANNIEVMDTGTLQVGTETQPDTHSVVITLTGPRGTHSLRNLDGALDNDGVQRAIRVMGGGALRLFGATPSVLKTTLAEHVPASSTTFHVADTVDWKAGDKIAISLTDFYGVGQTEVLTLAADASGTTLQTTTGIATSRWGLLQYPTNTAFSGNAVSLTPGSFTPASPTTATVLDERAEVVNLTRRIVIQGADDTAWNTSGFGVHVMISGLSSVAQVRGVEFRRCGQRQAMGRYPFHWHMLSYSSADAALQGGGTYLGDVVADNHYLRDSAIWDSQNRGVTIHGTCGVTVDNTFAVDIKGHAFFMEDGSERRNSISNCVAMKVRDPGAGLRIKLHDADASGFWLTNPENSIVRNSASDCTGRGLWNSFATTCFGASCNVALSPLNTDILRYEDNTGHSNGPQGIATEFAVFDEAGTTLPSRFDGNGGPFTLSRNKVWKNRSGGYLNRVKAARYVDWVAADNNGRDFDGQALGAEMKGTLLICKSLNSATPFPDARRVAVASYHYELQIQDITVLNYPYLGPTITGNGQFVYGGGAFDSSDLYSNHIAVAGARNSGWRMINSHAGYITPPPYFDGFPLAAPQNPGFFRYWSLPVTHDVYGYWGNPGDYLIPNATFFSYGLSAATPSPQQAGLLFTPDRFFGFGDFQVDAPTAAYWWGNYPAMPLRCGRLNTSNIEVAEHTLGNPAQSLFLPGFRSFCLQNGGSYKITWPGQPLPTSNLQVYIRNAYRAGDRVLVGLPWPGGTQVAGRLEAGIGSAGFSDQQLVNAGSGRIFSNTGTSIASVLGDTTGATMWQDSANNTVWLNIVGGLTFVGYDGTSDLALEKPMVIRLRAGP